MSIDAELDRLTVAMHQLTETYGDVRVTGRIKEHPDRIDNALDLVSLVVEEVRAVVERERIEVEFPLVPEEVTDREQEDQVRKFAAHSCDCDWCLHAGRGDTGKPIPTGLTLTAEQVAAIEARRSA